MKQCKGCRETKDDKEFTIRRYKSGHVGLKSKCNDCRHDERTERRANDPSDNERNKAYNKAHAAEIRGKKLVKNYWPNMTWQEAIAEWDRIFSQQGGHCYMCPNTERLHVDHWHGTFQVRGLLCYNCNNGIGRLKDSVQILEKAIEYLKKNAKK